MVGAFICGVTVLTVAFVRPVFAQEGRAKIRISYPSTSIANLALFAAQQWKIFEQNGLDVESIQMRSQAANAALASGDVSLCGRSRPQLGGRYPARFAIEGGLVRVGTARLFDHRPAGV
jgi:hypothetical protein